MIDVCVLGGGPAGISAGIYAVRSGMQTLILSASSGALSLAKRIDNYFGFSSISGAELLESGLNQFRSFGGSMIQAEVTSIEMIPGGFSLQTPSGNYDCKALVLAPGKALKKSSIPGESEFLGRGVSYCAVCDGFFFKKKNIAVIGSSEYAASEARHLLNFSENVVVLTDGVDTDIQMPCKVINKKIDSIFGEAKVNGVLFSDGESLPFDGVFIARGQAGASELALKLGIRCDGDSIVVDIDGMTNIPGVFAAGDCLGGLRQVSTAVGTGALAGQRAADFLHKA